MVSGLMVGWFGALNPLAQNERVGMRRKSLSAEVIRIMQIEAWQIPLNCVREGARTRSSAG